MRKYRKRINDLIVIHAKFPNIAKTETQKILKSINYVNMEMFKGSFFDACKITEYDTIQE